MSKSPNGGRMGTKSLFLLVALIATVWMFGRSLAPADEVTNCTIQALVGELRNFDNAIFAEDCSITITNQIVIGPIGTNTDREVTIDATDQTVTLSGAANGTNGFRIFYVRSNATLNLVHLILTAGRTNQGAAVFVERGGTLNAVECTFAGNVAAGLNGVSGTNGNNSSGTGGNGTGGTSGTAAFGGAIYNLGTLVLSNCIFQTNMAVGGTGGNGGAGGSGGAQGGNGGSAGSGAMAWGGAIFDGGTNPVSVIADCLFNGNTAIGGSGGTGGAAGAGPFVGNPGNGGAGATAYGAAYMSTGLCLVARCTFENNSGTGGNSMAAGSPGSTGNNGAKGGDALGGGACVLGNARNLDEAAPDVFVTNRIENCTFFQNQLHGGAGGNGGPGSFTGGNGGNGGTASGGGIYNTGQVWVVNCTLANCSAVGGTNGVSGSGPFQGSNGAIGAKNGGNLGSAGGTLYLQNSITVTNLSGGNVYTKASSNFKDAEYNISSDNSFNFTSTTHSKKNTDALIAPLANNGGPTPTMALQTGSPAIDAITNTAPDALPDTDQRGVTRTPGSGDIGAYEIGPAIIDQPTDQISTIGGSATFSVTPSSEDPVLQWQLAGTDIPGANISILTVTNLTPANKGPYRVIITDSTGTGISDSASVNFAPAFVTPPQNLTFVAGTTNNISVQVTADPKTNLPVTVRWFFGTNLLNNTTNFTSGITNTAYLVKPSVGTNDVGSYSVTLSNKYGTVTGPFTIALGTAPTIQSPPGNLTNNVGSSATLSVTASGTPAPAYQWQFNGTNLDGQTSSSYSINNVQPANQGTYSVIVTNSVGSNFASGFLTVVSASQPVIVTPPQNVLALSNSTAAFSVVASGSAPITYQWRLNSSPIQGAVGSSFAISGVAAEDVGMYDVVVANSLGSTRSPKASLTIVPSVVPPVISVINTGPAFGLSFTGIAGGSYIVDRRTNIIAGSWSPISTNLSSGGTMLISVPRTNNSSFFRVRVR